MSALKICRIIDDRQPVVLGHVAGRAVYKTAVIHKRADGGSALLAQFAYPEAVIMDKVGNLFISDRADHRIRKVDSNGITST